jgi:hypothetical protein
MIEHLANLAVQLRPSPIEGIGCFAIRELPEGTRLFSHPSSAPTLEYELVTSDVVPDYAREILDRYCYSENGIYEVPSWGLSVVSLENYLNHSFEPNVQLINGEFVTSRPVLKDEELTFDYDQTYGCKHDFNAY